ncbi:hypothetical protein J2S43_002697 [Catenuloplanes nepalensis]|uniref:Uncharacterized protein n=1 Tax=Catenuloplanes nepalensis TaxID=587533 RepID=A0ABT9MRZ0_9ACTN|nr:hypothetical protein [Catenuloplanes nepalensis]
MGGAQDPQPVGEQLLDAVPAPAESPAAPRR